MLIDDTEKCKDTIFFRYVLHVFLFVCVYSENFVYLCILNIKF